MNKQRSKELAPEACDCRSCRALRDECGEQNYQFLSRRLLIRGWAGVMTPAEKAYRRAHSEAAQHSAARLQERGFLPPKHRETQGQLAIPVQETGAAK
jgi:hypothetical protein